MKVDGSLGSLAQGVSQQAPTERRLGQHGAQVNMIADPVRGLSRRHGTIWQAERSIGSATPTVEEGAFNVTDSSGFRSFDYTAGGRDLVVLYRATPIVSGATLPIVAVYDKTNGQFLTLVRNATDTVLDTLVSGGVSAITAVGKYVFMAGNTITTAGTSTEVWAGSTNWNRTVLWVRGGAYSRTFSVTVTLTAGSQVTFSYTTPAASYPGTLDTSKVPVYAADNAGGSQTDSEGLYVTADGSYSKATLGWADWQPTSLTLKHGSTTLTNVTPSDPSSASEYKWVAGAATVRMHSSFVGDIGVSATYTHTKTINNPIYAQTVAGITNAYNTAVTNWIGTASAAVQPGAIATALKDAALAAGVTGTTVVGSTVVFTGVMDINVNDGGDGSLIKGLANKLHSVADLTDAHYIDKIVQISPTGGESFYMKATAKNAGITSGVTEVVWVEGARIDRSITSALIYGVADSTSFYIASTATLLNAILAGSHPTYAAATVGDDDSSPMPYFVGKKISYLGVFQDRLLVGSGAVLRFSKIGDYLNFFRSSVLTVAADDPFEILSQGSEDDTLRFSVLYDRDLILFGKRQYAVAGRSVLTPTSANMPVMSSHQGANDAPPVAAGGLMFYAKRGQAATSVHQIEPGRNPESPESYPTSSQLDDYMTGVPVELIVVPKPNMLLVRTSGARNTLFAYTYLDTNEKRVQDCWHRWDYSTALGTILGASTTQRDGVLVFTLRQGNDYLGVYRQWLVADLQPLDVQMSTRPYLDSTRSYASVVSTPGSVHSASAGYAAAYASGTTARFLGVSDLSNVAAMVTDVGHSTGLTVGRPFDSFWEPTNPAARESDGRAINAGRIVVTSVLVAFTSSSGYRSVVTAFGANTTMTFNGRVMGDVNNIVGVVPVTSGRQSIVIGRESREYVQTIHALTWLPLNLTAVDWTGQLFHRPQRVG